MKKKKVLVIERTCINPKIIKKVGLDTDICLSWFKNQKNSRDYKPNFARKGNILYINSKVFAQLLFKIKENKNEAKIELGKFLKINNIKCLMKIPENEQKFKENFEKLSQQKFFNNPEKSDLEIIAIYKAYGIDCIFSGNTRHFEEPCKFLDIAFEKKIVIEEGSERDVARMLRELYKHRY